MTVNVLVMIETAPGSEEYIQIEIKKEQHKKMLEWIEVNVCESDTDGFSIPIVGHRPVKIPDLEQYYD